MHNLESIATAVKAMLDQHFDGYALVGFTVGQDHPMTIVNTDGSAMKRMAIQTMLLETAAILTTKAHE